jgi:hypothetical protein
MTPEDWISEFESGNISSYGLIEAFGRFDSWFVGIEKLDSGGFIPLVWKDEEGQRFLNIYSKKEYIDVYANIYGKEFFPELYLKLPGYWIFQNIPSGIDYINIDPESEHSVHYKKQQFSVLEEIGYMLEIDLPMRRILQTPLGDFPKIREEFLQLKDYKKYYLVLSDSKIPLAPDDNSRKLIPVFTSQLAAKLFMDWLEKVQGIRKLESILHNGRELFLRIQNSKADGIAFNCSGPITPCGFMIDLAKIVIETK